MINTIWAVIVPNALSVYNMIVMRTYFKTQIPVELRESAQIDGCGDWRYLLQITLPLSGSVLGVVALYYAVARWNSYFTEMVYLQNRDMLPLQNILREILIINNPTTEMGISPEAEAKAAERSELLKYSVIVLASLPMMMMYPFFQKSFVKGVMVGSVKG
jgi:multiple sugar transport system permease protein/putative aldouronate transport system permease protein